jgi:hypothetical protein
MGESFPRETAATEKLGPCPIDNNISEQEMKGVVLSRKNSEA